MALRDLLRKLGIGSGGDEVQPGVRRARLPQRAPDAPTVRVPAGSSGAAPEPYAPPSAPPAGSGSGGLPPQHAQQPPSGPAPAAPAPPAAPPSPAAPATPAHAPPAPAPGGAPGATSDLGGATQYIRVGEPEPMDLVGVLVGIEGPLKGQIYRVQDGETKLGREGCQVTLPSRRISRFHARIHHADGAFVIEANPEVMGKNPTVLNDEEIDAEALSDGDTLRLGDCTFRFRTV